MTQESDIYSEYEQNFRYAKEYWGPQVVASERYIRTAAGQAWTNEELRDLSDEGREPLNLNIMRRPMQFFSGYLRDNINSNVVSATEGSNPKTADQLTKALSKVWDRGKFFPTFLDSCDEAGKSGIALAGVEMDYSHDFINGDAVCYKRTSNSFYLDPAFERIDLKDCGFAITRDLISRNNTDRLLSYIGQNIQKEVPYGFNDNKFMSFHPQNSNLYQNRNIIAYDQYYRKTSRTKKYLIDPKAGFFRDISDLPKEEVEKLKIGIQRMKTLREDAEFNGQDPEQFPELEIRNVERDFIELNVFLNGVLFYTGIDKTGIDETYPFVPVLCYFEPSIWDPLLRVQGFPSTLYSDQRQFNKRHMKIIDMMDSEISNGYIYLIGSVPDPTDLQQGGQNKIIGVDPENAPEGINSVREIRGGGANPSLIEYQKILDDLSLTLLNVNESILGIDQDSKTIISGRLAQVRIAQGLRINRKYFDNIEVSQAILAELSVKVLQKYPVEKIARMIGEEPEEEFFTKDFESYEVTLKQGIRSQSQRDAYYSELVNLKREGIVNISEDEIVKALDITGISSLQESIAGQKQQQQVQQEKIDMQERVALELANATTEEKLGLAIERRSRADSNEALKEERISEASENRAQAALARAKTITEIANMEDQRILKVLEFVNAIEREEAIEQDRVSNKTAVEAEQISQEVKQSEDEVKQESSQQNQGVENAQG